MHLLLMRFDCWCVLFVDVFCLLMWLFADVSIFIIYSFKHNFFTLLFMENIFTLHGKLVKLPGKQ